MSNYSLIIGWLYPDIMSIYGDRGNIVALSKRAQWRGIDVSVRQILLDSPAIELESCDLLFMGGAQDRQQKMVSEDLRTKSTTISRMVEKGVPGLYICGAFQFLGKYYKEADGTMIEGLGILDLNTINPGFEKGRLIGNVIIKADPDYLYEDRFSPYLVGFENHGGRTYLGKGVRPLGKVVAGFGNNGEDETEGAVYKNSFGSYFHGPLMPKNPHFADYLIAVSLEVKYGKKVALKSLDDTLEKKAHVFVANRLGIKL
jgi:CobQ-like glutamine amidotransferase family enzyme